jgi:hypothetical protein
VTKIQGQIHLVDCATDGCGSIIQPPRRYCLRCKYRMTPEQRHEVIRRESEVMSRYSNPTPQGGVENFQRDPAATPRSIVAKKTAASQNGSPEMFPDNNTKEF